jgi:tripartite-type tricarboxylate transporter receptor subunit TctC
MAATRRGVFALLGSATAGATQAQPTATWPERTVRLVSAYPAGGGIDLVARILAPRLAEAFHRSFVVENRTGGSGSIGVRHVAQQPADGHALLVDAIGIVTNPRLLRDPGYDVLRDFAPVAQLLSIPFVVVVRPEHPIRSLADLRTHAAARPGHLNVAGGTTTLLAARLYGMKARVELNFVPYRGSAPAITALLSGEADVMFADLPSVIGQLSAGSLRPLAVSTHERTSLLPDVPSAREAGQPDFVVDSWYGIYAPARTPNWILDRLHTALAQILQSSDVRDRFAALGASPVVTSRSDFRAHVAAELARWSELVERAGISQE